MRARRSPPPYDAPRRGLVLNDAGGALRRRRAGRSRCARRWSRPPAAARVAGSSRHWLGAVAARADGRAAGRGRRAAADIALSGWAPARTTTRPGSRWRSPLFDELSREPPRAAGARRCCWSAPVTPSTAIGLPEGAVLVELGPCGAGRPVLRARHPQARAAAARAAEALGAAMRRRAAACRRGPDRVRRRRGVVPRAASGRTTPWWRRRQWTQRSMLRWASSTRSTLRWRGRLGERQLRLGREVGEERARSSAAAAAIARNSPSGGGTCETESGRPDLARNSRSAASLPAAVDVRRVAAAQRSAHGRCATRVTPRPPPARTRRPAASAASPRAAASPRPRSRAGGPGRSSPRAAGGGRA